ncbi:MAG TPA: YbaK/EbsC family protein [Phycisphaerae bacterium]|nr:YbaK/EbsC family protein [Phycisphaerae bacterium]
MTIEEYLKKSGVAYKMREHPPAYTAQELAAEEHVSGNMFAKAVVVHTDKGCAMCALPASCKLDMKKIAKVLKSKKVRLADETEMAKLFPDSEVGAEPPFGNLYDLPTIVDERLAQDEEIVFQAGTHRHAIRMKYADFASLVGPTVADVAVHL